MSQGDEKVSRVELRYLVRHPIRWFSIWWIHVGVFSILIGIAIGWTSEVFEPVLRPDLWPIAMGAVAFGVLLSSLAPFERRIRAVVSASMVFIGVARAVAMIEVLIHTDISPALLLVIAMYSLLLSSLGVVWSDWTVECGSRTTVEAGRAALSEDDAEEERRR